MCFCNCDRCKNVNWGSLILGAVILTIIGFVVQMLGSYLMMSYYLMPEFFGVWSKVMMPVAGPPPMTFFITSLVFSFVSGLVLAYLYAFIKEILPKGYWQKVNCFTAIVSGLYFVFFTLPVYLLFNAPLALNGAWFVSSIVIYYLSSMAFAKIIK
ncbi:MAG: hypothetical protein WC520_00060 [Candidatus Paceibacterota bacterium]